MCFFPASNECSFLFNEIQNLFSKSSLSTDNRGSWNFLALKNYFLKTWNLSTELWNYLHKHWALFYFKALNKYPLTNPLHCSLARKEPHLREKAIKRQRENWEFKPKSSLELVGFFGAFCLLKKKKVFLLSTSAFKIAEWWWRRKVRISNNRVRLSWKLMQISHEI